MLAKGDPEIYQYVVVDAAGNIVLLFDCSDQTFEVEDDYVRHVVNLCHAGTRIDIVGFISRIAGAVSVSFWNPDGTPEKMCGNACRSIPTALHAWHGVDGVASSFPVVTEFCRTMVRTNGDGSTSVEIPLSVISVWLQSDGALVDVGTPHFVREADALFSEYVNIDGERLSTAAAPVNATFCKVMPAEILARTFERGVGETKSCGTGAIAIRMALEKRGAIEKSAEPRVIRFASGHALVVSYNADETAVSVTGRCELLAKGRISSGLTPIHA